MPGRAADLLRRTHVSYSKLQAYQQCPMRFKLEYLDECEPEPSRAIQLGTVVHAVVAQYLRAIKGRRGVFNPKMPELKPFIKPVCARLRVEGDLTEVIDEGEIVQLLKGFTRIFPSFKGESI